MAKIIISKEDFKKFPKTRYQGSKRKINSWIYDNVKDLRFNSALDGCGGSGSVSYLFKRMGKEVTYNDKLKFNYLIGKAIIQNQRNKFNDIDIVNLFEWASNHDSDGFIERTFEGVYYPANENAWLGKMNNGIINMNHYHGQVLDYKKSMAYYALFQACLMKRPFNLFHRNNLDIRMNDVPRNFGNKTTWEKPFDELFKNFIKEVNSLVFDSGVDCRATNESIFDIQEGEHDLVYIDPPYIAQESTNEISDYIRGYHFLEGLANYDDWDALIDYDSHNLRFRQEGENFFSRENINATFHELISKFRDSKIVISYKEGGIPSIRTVVRIMQQYKRHVYTRSIPYAYALNAGNANNREVLIIGV